jgi:prophage maintenance system killer protein
MSPGDDPSFLSLEEVLAIQVQMLDTHGGQAGIRDRSSLESAVGMPTQTSNERPTSAHLFDIP